MLADEVSVGARVADPWKPENRYLWAHHACLYELHEQMRAKAERLVIEVPS